MITNKCLCLLVAFSLATLSFASCKITTTPAQSPDTPPQPQPSPTSTPSAPGFIPAVNISAMGIPDYDVSEAQLEQHPGGVPFKIILYIDPLQPEDLDPAVIDAYDVSKQWDSERVLALLPPASPVTTEFGFFSDGLIYSSADTFTGGTTRSELPSGSDVTFTFTTWTQLPDAGEDGAEIGVGDRIWYKSFNLDSDNTRFVSDLDTDIDAGATEAQTPTGKSTTVEDYANESKYNFQSDRYAVQFWFAQNPESGPDTGTDEGLALIPTTIDIPISPIVTINRVDPEPTVSGEFIAHSGVLLWDLKDDVPLDTSFDSDQILINNVFNTTGDLSTLPLYRDYFIASAASDALGESTDTTELPTALLYGFSQIANFVDDDPEGSSDCDEGPEVGSFGFASDGLCFSSVFSLPVDRDSLFFPMEPHIIESDTIWLYCEKDDDHPNIYVENGYIPDTVVTVDIDPEESGEVELTLNNENKEPDAEVMFEKYTWYFEKGSFQTESETKEVTLTAIPEPGYRFSHWEKVIETGVYVTEFDLEGHDMTSATITFEIELGHFFHRNTYGLIAHFEPLSEEPQDYVPQDEPVPSVQETLYTSLDANGQCWASQSSCSCNMVIVIEGTDLTDGSYPVTNVTLVVNGENWHDSGAILETHYTRTVERSVNCDAEFNIEVTATNLIGQTVSATGYVSTARN